MSYVRKICHLLGLFENNIFYDLKKRREHVSVNMLKYLTQLSLSTDGNNYRCPAFFAISVTGKHFFQHNVDMGVSILSTRSIRWTRFILPSTISDNAEYLYIVGNWHMAHDSFHFNDERKFYDNFETFSAIKLAQLLYSQITPHRKTSHNIYPPQWNGLQLSM